ncbi:MAG: type II secretion system protein [bacterium]
MKKERFYNKNKKQGFTLLELMIVIAIISLLAVALIPNFVNARNAAKLTSCTTILKNISSVVEMYSNDNDGKYPDSDFTITLSGNPLDSYIDKDYKCPVANDYYEYKARDNVSLYYIYCPTYRNSLKHRSREGVINKVVFSPEKGIIVVR